MDGAVPCIGDRLIVGRIFVLLYSAHRKVFRCGHKEKTDSCHLRICGGSACVCQSESVLYKSGYYSAFCFSFPGYGSACAACSDFLPKKGEGQENCFLQKKFIKAA